MNSDPSGHDPDPLHLLSPVVKVNPAIGDGSEIHPSSIQVKNYITLECGYRGIPAKLGLAVAYQESTFKQYKLSNGKWVVNEKGGGYGIMQLQMIYHPEAPWIGKFNVTNDWHLNVCYGLDYLLKCYNEAKRLKYTGDNLLRATYSDYNSGSCSGFITSTQVATDVKLFMQKYAMF
jgi:hypothetical protein